jgi:hypothetical protein
VSHKQTNRREVLRPFLTLLEGTPVPHVELVNAGRRMAEVMVDHGRPITLCPDGQWAGVWDLQYLTDDEAVAWGMWVAMKIRRKTMGRKDGSGP